MFIDKAIEDLQETLASKNQDYRISGEFSNFEYVAAMTDAKIEDVILTQIGIKLGRLNGLRRSGDEPRHESMQDTYKDLAGYAIILYAYALSQDESGKWTEWRTPEEKRTNLLEGYKDELPDF